MTPSGATASAPDFIPIAYADLVACLLEGPAQGAVSAEEEVVLSIYLKVLAAGSLRSEIRALSEVI